MCVAAALDHMTKMAQEVAEEVAKAADDQSSALSQEAETVVGADPMTT